MPPNLEIAYALDTHALIWHPTAPDRLSDRARAVIVAAERGETVLVVSAIALAEMLYADQKFRLFSDFEQACEGLFALPYFRFEAFGPEDAVDLARDTSVPEMHDRIIYGLARRLRLPLVSKDPAMRGAVGAEVVW